MNFPLYLVITFLPRNDSVVEVVEIFGTAEVAIEWSYDEAFTSGQCKAVCPLVWELSEESLMFCTKVVDEWPFFGWCRVLAATRSNMRIMSMTGSACLDVSVAVAHFPVTPLIFAGSSTFKSPMMTVQSDRGTSLRSLVKATMVLLCAGFFLELCGICTPITNRLVTGPLIRAHTILSHGDP